MVICSMSDYMKKPHNLPQCNLASAGGNDASETYHSSRSKQKNRFAIWEALDKIP